MMSDAFVASAATVDFDSMSAKSLKFLLDSVGEKYSSCREKSELLALVKAYPHPFPSSTIDGGRGPSPSARASALAVLDGAPLFAAIRAIGDLDTRRNVTARVYEAKLRAWRASPLFLGMSKHLVDDVHPMFRRGFSGVLASSRKSGTVATAAFARVNDGLHHHHSLEDSMWFPRLRRAHPELGEEIDALEQDHAELVRLQSRVAAGELVALEAFVASLEDHLNREELLTLPALMDGSGGM